MNVMKFIGKWPLLGICIVSLMMACKPDKGFETGFEAKFFIQKDSIIDGDTIPYFAPYFIIKSNQMLYSYSLYSTLYDAVNDKTDTTGYPLEWQSANSRGEYRYYSDMGNQYPWVRAEKVTTGPYYLKVKNTSGEVYTNQGSFLDLRLDSVMSEVKVEHVQYYVGEYFAAMIQPVRNAEYYVLSISPKNQPKYRTLISATNAVDVDGRIQVRTNTLNQYDDGTELIVRVAAYNGYRVIRESQDIALKLGTQLNQSFD